MAKKPKFSMKEGMIRAAANRAKMIAYLNTHPGEHSSHHMAEQLGISNSDASYTAARLAQSGQINVRKEGRGKPGHYFLDGALPVEEVIDPESRTISHFNAGLGKSKRVKKLSNGPQDIELVIRLKIVVEVG